MPRSTAVWVQLGSLSLGPLYVGLAHLRGYLEVQRTTEHLRAGLGYLAVGLVYLTIAVFARHDRARIPAALLLLAAAGLLLVSVATSGSPAFALPATLFLVLGVRAVAPWPRWPPAAEWVLCGLALGVSAASFLVLAYSLQPFLADEAAR